MTTKRNDDEFLATARQRFAIAESEEAEIRNEAKLDLRFLSGRQWDDADLQARKRQRKPALVFNRLPTFVHQVANEARQNKPQVKFGPQEDGDKDTADVLEGLARRIQYDSTAAIAYETALTYSTACSFGHFRLLSKYNDLPGAPALDQDLEFASISDPFSVYGVIMPRLKGQKPRWGFVITTMSRDDYIAEYGESKLAGAGGFEWGADIASSWVTEDEVRVAEYYYTESRKRTWQVLSTGQKVYRDEYQSLPEGVEVVFERRVSEDVVRWAKINGAEILEETEWVGPSVPIFSALGWSLVVENRYELYSLIRFMRDPSKLINIYKSGIAEGVGTHNRAPFIGYLGQFKSRAKEWSQANSVNYPYLEVDPVMVNGTLAPLPQRQQVEPAIQALSLAAAQEVDDLKSIAGIFDASLGNQGNETSGIAIQRRQAQSGLTNYHFADNLARAQEEAGRELGFAIPHVYDRPGRIVRILGADEKDKVVAVNAEWHDPESGQLKRYMIADGRYDITVSVGPSNTTKRQEEADTTSSVIQAAPQMMEVIGDLFFNAQDSAGSDKIAERLRKWIALTKPGLVDDGQQGKPQIPPQVQQQMQALSQQHEQLVNTVHQLSSEIETKAQELASRERIAAMQEETKRTIALANLNAQEGMQLLEAELDTIRHRLDMLHQAEQQQAEQAHQAAMRQAQPPQPPQAPAEGPAAQSPVGMPASMPDPEQDEPQEEPPMAA